MRSLFKLINEDLKTIVKKPKRILKVSSLKKLRAYGWWYHYNDKRHHNSLGYSIEHQRGRVPDDQTSESSR